MRPPLLAVLTLLSAISAFAGDPASPAAPAAIDWRQAELNDGNKAALKELGYRLEDDGRILSPETHQPISQEELHKILARAQMATHRASLERLNLLLEGAGDGPLSDSLREEAQGLSPDLPPHVAAALNDKASTAAVLRQMTDAGLDQATLFFDGSRSMAERRAAAQPVSAAHGGKSAPPPYFEDSERVLGEKMRAATVAQLHKYPVGKEVTGRLKGKDGKPDLPPMIVGDTGVAVAVYDYRRQAVVVSQEMLSTSIVEDFPPKERVAVRKSIAPRADLIKYLEAHPEAVTNFTRKNDAVIAHELTHAWQDRRDTLLREMARGNLPSAVVLEYEEEAFFEKNRYLHSKLRTDPKLVADDDELRDYLAMTKNYEQWRGANARHYETSFPSTAMNLKDARRIQARRIDSVKGREVQTREQQEAKSLDLLGMSRASRAAAQAERNHKTRSKGFAKTSAIMTTEGPGLLARYYLERALDAENNIEFSILISRAEEFAAQGDNAKLLEEIRSLKGRRR